MGDEESAVARGFSALAGVYVDTTAQALRLLRLAAPQPGERLLDAGCGPGTVTVHAADMVGPAGSVVGVDLAAEMLVRARAAVAGQGNVEIRAGDVTALDVPDGVFDVVVANSVVQFAGPAALPEWRRVTRPGGRVACSLPWGPRLWTELCVRYVGRTAGPYRSFAEGQLARAARRPDAERVRERLGFARVEGASEHLVARHDSPEDAWAALATHGARLFLDALDPAALAGLREEFLALVATDGGGAELRSEFLYWCFTTAA